MFGMVMFAGNLQSPIFSHLLTTAFPLSVSIQAPIAVLRFVVLFSVAAVVFADPFEYEVKAASGDGITNVGGGEGTSFELHERNAAVKKLDVFFEANIIQALRVTFSNDKTAQVGDIRTGPPDKSFTFEPGEKLKGNIILTGNGIGTRLGFIQFTTSKDKMFEAGNSQAARQFTLSSGNSYLMGFHGKAGSDIDNLGIYLMKPLQSEKLVNTVYDIPLKPSASEDSLRNEAFVNMSPEPQKVTIRYQKVESTSSEWTITESFSATLGIEVSGGIPEVADVSTSLEISVSSESTQTSGMSTEITNEETRELTNPGCTKGTHRIVDFKFKSPVPYKGDLLYTFQDQTTLSIPVTGTLKSVFVSDTNVTTSVEPITGGICGAPMAPVPSMPIETKSPVLSPAPFPTSPTTAVPSSMTSPTTAVPTRTGDIPVGLVPTPSPVRNGDGLGDLEGVVSVVYIENIENAQFFFGGSSTLIDGTSQMGKGKGMLNVRRLL